MMQRKNVKRKVLSFGCVVDYTCKNEREGQGRKNLRVTEKKLWRRKRERERGREDVVRTFVRRVLLGVKRFPPCPFYIFSGQWKIFSGWLLFYAVPTQKTGNYFLFYTKTNGAPNRKSLQIQLLSLCLCQFSCYLYGTSGTDSNESVDDYTFVPPTKVSDGNDTLHNKKMCLSSI